jgi:hypothetical protein
MALRAEQIEMLQRLAQKALTIVDFKKHGELKMVQGMVDLGYVKDFARMLNSQGRPHRIPIGLHIWGITNAGKAILEQKALAEEDKKRKGDQGQLNLELLLHPPATGVPGLTIKTGVVRRHTVIQRKKGLPTAIYETPANSTSVGVPVVRGASSGEEQGKDCC